ncbi:MAG: TIGR03943 family protein [Anaerolinea sp.]|nr:TIGR03943 family protein [Anaerolinea sp.]
MSLRGYRLFQGLLMALLGLFLLSRLRDGRILLYLNQRFVWLVLLAALVLLGMAQVVLQARPGLREETERRSPMGLVWLALPLAIGVLIPARSLTQEIVAVRGMQTQPIVLRANVPARPVTIPTTQWSILDWIQAFRDAPDDQVGKAVDVTGFVFRDSSLRADQMIVGRFAITCCVADASAVGVVVHSEQAASFAQGEWVRVQGRVSWQDVNGEAQLGFEAETIERMDAPEQPYLFP